MGHAYARMAIQAKTATKHPMWNVRMGIILVITIKYAALFLLQQVLADAVQIIRSARLVVFFVASDLGASGRLSSQAKLLRQVDVIILEVLQSIDKLKTK
ncbi:hypothetical protein ABFA07_015068 [Porites harrisoni]